VLLTLCQGRQVSTMSHPTSSALIACPFLHGMGQHQLAVLASAAEEVTVPAKHRLFEDGGNAKKFWLIESGRVALDVYAPGEGRVVIDALGIGDLLGWSWLFPPYQWAFGAVAVTEMRAFEFDAATVRASCETDPGLGYDLTRRVALVLARRLRTTRIKLLDCQPERQ
jgi:CRP/FNR family transcriptional regulator, cyclic AMP receptor protein